MVNSEFERRAGGLHPSELPAKSVRCPVCNRHPKSVSGIVYRFRVDSHLIHLDPAYDTDLQAWSEERMSTPLKEVFIWFCQRCWQRRPETCLSLVRRRLESSK